MNTFTLRSGVIVLAKDSGSPFTYANRRQAERRAAELRRDGIDASVHKTPFVRPFFVAIRQVGQ